jgi:hypothetical protein
MHIHAPQHLSSESLRIRTAVPDLMRPALIPIAKRVFWWGEPEEWMEDAVRFAAQVMTYGNWDDTTLALNLLGDSVFRQALQTPPAGVFDIKSWNFWHLHYQQDVPPLPTRQL